MVRKRDDANLSCGCERMSDASLTRFLLNGTVVEEGGQQFVDGAGVAADFFKRVHRPEPHGFASSPINGGIGLLLQSRASRDAAFMLGGENPGNRPVLPPGASAVYDANGNFIKLLMDSVIMDFANRSITMTGGDWTITGDVRIQGALHVTGAITTDATNPNKHSH